MSLQETLNGIFREVFDDDSIMITPEMTSNDIEGWDSLSHVNLILVIETRFGIRFTQRDMVSLKNVGDLINCIQKRLECK